MRLPVPSKLDFEMTARPKRRVDGSLAKTLPTSIFLYRYRNMSLKRIIICGQCYTSELVVANKECDLNMITAKILLKFFCSPECSCQEYLELQSGQWSVECVHSFAKMTEDKPMTLHVSINP